MNASQPDRGNAVLDECWQMVDGMGLYDIETDPAQASEIASDYPEQVVRLKAAYDEWWA